MDIDGTMQVEIVSDQPNPMVNLAEENIQAPERRSERLKKYTAMTTMEKVDKMAIKANLEGKPVNHNSFFVLPIEEIAHVTSCMGIRVDDDNFATFNLIKDLKKVRDDLYQK
jgi:hypothetical protein